MENDPTADTVHALETMVASLTELIAVQEKVVSEQSERIMKNEQALKESNERFLAFIKEAAMRLKNPLEVVEENLAVLMNDVERGETECGNVSLQLRVQMKNLEQIRKNIIELNKAIVEHSEGIPEASAKFLTE